MRNIFSKTTENRTQNGVKSYSFPTRLLSPILIFAFLTLGVGQMWGAVTLYYQKDMPANNYSASNSATMTQSSVNSDRYYCTLNLTASSSYGFYIKWDNNYYKVSATAQNYTDVLLYDYGSTNYGNSPHRVTYTTPSSGGNTIFIFDTSNKKICVSPTSSQTIKISYATASGKDSYYDLGNYTDLSQDGSSANYYVDLDLTAVKYYMFMQLKVGSSTYSYWRGTSTLTEGNSVSLYDYGTSNYGNSSDKVNFTPSAAGKYRFTWNQLDKTVKLQRVYKVTYDGNGSTSGTTPDDAYYPNGATVMVASNSGSLAKTGYTFDGWNTANDGSGTSYDAGANITVTDSDVKLYAQWAQQSLTITDYPKYLSQTEKLNLTISYENIPEGYCFRVHELRTNGYYNNEAQGAYNPISGTGSTTYTSSAYLPTGDVDRIVVELWKIDPFSPQSVVSNEVAVTVEQSYNIDVKAKTDGLISPVGGTVSPASVSPTEHKGQTITASEPKTGYKFTGWTAIPENNITFENASALSTTVYATSGGTVYANYVRYVNIFLPNTGNNWNTSDVKWKFDKLPGDAENTVRLAVDINKSDYSSSNYKLGFNIYHADWEYKWWHNKSDKDSHMDAHNCTNWGFNTKDGNYKTHLDLNVSGTYTFTLTNSNNSSTQQLSVTYPDKSFIEGAFPTAWSEDAYTLTEEGDIQSVKINITTTGDKEFRLVSHGKLFGTSTKITAAANSQTLSAKNMADKGAKMTLDAYVTGEYTFTYNKSTKNLTVTFPTAYRVTYGVGTGYTSMGGVSTTPNITSGDYVIEGREITFTATPNLGYKCVGWYNDAECTGAAVSTDASYTIASLSANTTLYAKFELMDIKINSDVNGVYPTPWSQYIMDHDPGSPAVYTYSTTLTTRVTEQGQASFNSGYHFNFLDSNGELLNYNGVQTPPTYSGSSIDGVRKTADDNPTIQFGLTRKSYVTITLTLQEGNKPTVNIAADPIYTITHGDPTHGSYTIQVGDASSVSTNTESVAGTTITLAPTNATGYHFDSWIVTKAEGGTVTVTNNQFTMPSNDVTIAATFLPNTYDVILDVNGGEGDNQTVTVKYHEAMPPTLKGGGMIAERTKTGYIFGGYAANNDGTGTLYYTSERVSNHIWDVAEDKTHIIYAKWTPKTSALKFDYQTSAEGYGTSGSVTAATAATYDAAMPELSGTLPTAANGYAFMGFFDETGGNGTKYYNTDGSSAHNWDKDVTSETTLYAYYKKAEITKIAFTPGNIVEPNATVSVKATVEPTPVGSTTICWRVLYSNDNPLDPQPTFTPADAQGNSVSFIAPEASGSYKVEATLRKGTSCDGEEIHTFTAPFQVAGDHTVTVQYKCGNTTIKAPTSVAGKPLDWTEITAPEIVGYSFLKWVEGDGITIEGATNGEKADATINFTAIYDGQLTAIYTQKQMIYFNNTLGWSDVWVYFYNSNEYWSDTYGSGAQQTQAFNGDHKPYWEQEHGKMTRIEGTNIWYFDYTAVGYTTRLNVVFTERDQHGNQWFHQTNVVRRGDHKSSLPMFVPLAGQTPVTRNTSAKYYNEGYWMNYPENTGYSLHIYKGTAKGELDEIRSIAFPFTADKTMPMEVTLELNANTTYGYEIHRADNTYHANGGTIKINASSDIKLSKDQRGGIKTSAAGDYVLN